MRIHLRSPQYTWIQGEVLIGGPRDSTFAGIPGASAGQEVVLPSLDSGHVTTVAISEPGVFLILLLDVSAVRTLDGRQISIPVLPLHEHEITSSDLASGTKEIVVGPLGTLHIKVVDKNNKPVSGVAVTLCPEDSEASHEVYTSEGGEITFWALPEGGYRVRFGGVFHRVEILGGQEAPLTLIRPGSL